MGKLQITNRDRVLRAWQESIQLVRDYQDNANEIANEDKHLADLFAKYAEDEAFHAKKLLEILHEYEN